MPTSDRRTRRAGARRAFGVLGELLVTAGVVVLLFVAWQLWWTDVLADRAQSEARDELRQEWAIGEGNSRLPSPVDAEYGEPFGLMYVPALRDRAWGVPIVQGTEHYLLASGVGHHVESAMPGRRGNFAVAGHRTTYSAPFADIEQIRRGDQVIVETKKGWFVYELERHEIIDFWEGWVLDPVPGKPRTVRPTEALITIYACHPRYSLAQRYVWFGQLVDKYPKSAGTPPAVQKYGQV